MNAAAKASLKSRLVGNVLRTSQYIQHTHTLSAHGRSSPGLRV